MYTSGMQVSGTFSQPEAFRKTLPKSFCNLEREYTQLILHVPQKWLFFCISRDLDPYKATPTNALDFMTDPFEQGLGYSAMNTDRSALLQVIHLPSKVSFGHSVYIWCTS